MSESKRFKPSEIYSNTIMDTENCINNGSHCRIYDIEEVVDLLNKLVKDNEELGISIKLFEDDIATKDKKIEEQQATIQRMKHSLNTIYKAFEKHYGYDMRNAVWLIDELSYDEIVDELYIAETDSKNRKEASMYWKKKVDEQQATIEQLQKSEDVKEFSALFNQSIALKREIKDLKEENEKLTKMLNANYKTNNELVQYIQMLESDNDE